MTLPAIDKAPLRRDDREQRPSAAPDTELRSVQAHEPLRGLCVNCDVRDTCMLRPARGGVWHCEEYR